MEILYYPDKKTTEAAMKADSPLLVLISHDGKKILTAPIDDSLEHLILLKQLGFPEKDLDKYFRVVVNKAGADWSFVYPSEYKGIPGKERRIQQFYKDGFKTIPCALKKFSYDVPLEIPKRFRRHISMLKNGDA